MPLTRPPHRRLRALPSVLLLLAAFTTSGWSAAPGARAAATDPIAHDPSVIGQGDYFYAVITGDIATRTYLPLKRSRDLVHWEELGVVFQTPPAWIPEALGVIPGDFWAPDINYFNGRYHLYYAASQFGINSSVIGLATNTTLDPGDPDYRWVDEGLVLRSTPGESDFNAIDPEVVTDAEGRMWLAFGSFWGGIKMRRLDETTGKPSTTDTELHSLAWRPNDPHAIEGPSIHYRGGFYYLFVSFDFCCRGVDSTYRVMVGRSRDVTGPYVDANGVDMMQGGGTELLRGYNEFAGPGHGDVFSDAGRDYFAHHYYDVDDQALPKLSIRRIIWRGGWPRLSDPLSGSRDVGRGSAWFEVVERNSGKVVETASCGFEGADIRLATYTGSPCQQWRLEMRGAGSVSLNNRFSNNVAEVAACRNEDGANVAQWIWLANDCQRFTLHATTAGWMRIESRLPGGRALEAAGCGTAEGANVVVGDPIPGRCQEFRLEPVGKVLLAAPASRLMLDVPGCDRRHANRVAYRDARGSGCRLWRFRHAHGGYYTIRNARRGGALAPARCYSARGGLVLAGRHWRGSHCRHWRMEPRADGSFALVSERRGQTEVVRILRP